MKDEQTGLPEFTTLELRDPNRFWVAGIQDLEGNMYYFEVTLNAEKKSSQVLRSGELIAIRLGTDALRNIARQKIRNTDELLQVVQKVELDQTYGQFVTMIKKHGIIAAKRFRKKPEAVPTPPIPEGKEVPEMPGLRKETTPAEEAERITTAFREKFPKEYKERPVLWDGTIAFVKEQQICRCGQPVIVHAKLTMNHEKTDFVKQQAYFSPDGSAEYVDGAWTHTPCKSIALLGTKRKPRVSRKLKEAPAPEPEAPPAPEAEAPEPIPQPPAPPAPAGGFNAVDYLEEIMAPDGNHTNDQVLAVLRCLLRAGLIKSAS